MLQNFPTPTTQKELRGFLGLLQFYRDMLPYLAYTAHKLYAATSSKTEFKWTDELEEAYRAAKSMIEKTLWRRMGRVNTGIGSFQGRLMVKRSRRPKFPPSESMQTKQWF